MDRFFVPRLGFMLVLGLAAVLIGVIVLRSPDTHANLWTELDPGYTRTVVSSLSGEVVQGAPMPEIALLQPSKLQGGGLPVEPGKLIFVTAGCSMCHGVDARGGPVGPSLAGSSPNVVKRMVREGPGGMPAHSEAHLSDADLGTLAAYLQGLEVSRPDSEKIAALQRLTYDPSVPVSELLKGKAAIRRSCGACHAQPDEEDIQRAFSSDAEAAGLMAEMVAETNLNLEDARAITYYMLAILHGADPMKER